MPVYTVHAPVTGNAGIAATDSFVFVRDGFHFWAAVLGVVWLAWHRLWLALIGWIVVMAVDRCRDGAARRQPDGDLSRRCRCSRC